MNKAKFDSQVEHARNNMTTDDIRKSIPMREKSVELAAEQVEQAVVRLGKAKRDLAILKSDLQDVRAILAALKHVLKERTSKSVLKTLKS